MDVFWSMRNTLRGFSKNNSNHCAGSGLLEGIEAEANHLPSERLEMYRL